ncbi:hypothetical protein THAOC_26306, partial [Thalassiosira oceanica]
MDQLNGGQLINRPLSKIEFERACHVPEAVRAEGMSARERDRIRPLAQAYAAFIISVSAVVHRCQNTRMRTPRSEGRHLHGDSEAVQDAKRIGLWAGDFDPTRFDPPTSSSAHREDFDRFQPISHGETPCRRRDAPWVSGGRPGHLSGMTPRPERRRHESSDEDDDGSDDGSDLSTPPGGPRGCRPATGPAFRTPATSPRPRGSSARGSEVARRVQREERRDGRTVYRDKSEGRREVDSAANEADLAWTEREREERQLRSNKGARQRELEDLEAAELAAISSMTVARGIDNQYLESQKNAESRPWRRTLGKKREEESAGTDGALEADGEETRRQRRKISPRPRREVADVQGASSVSGLGKRVAARGSNRFACASDNGASAGFGFTPSAGVSGEVEDSHPFGNLQEVPESNNGEGNEEEIHSTSVVMFEQEGDSVSSRGDGNARFLRTKGTENPPTRLVLQVNSGQLTLVNVWLD